MDWPKAGGCPTAGWHARRIAPPFLASVVLALLCAPQALATSGYLSTWSGLYPGSTSDNAASCQLCHGTSTQNLNPYGHDLAQCNGATGTITQRILAAEGLNSDGDAGGFTNLAEINANTQPGWTTGNMPVWGRTSCTAAGTNTAPSGLSLDPAPAGCQSDAECDDGVFCNGAEICDGTGTCQPGTPPCTGPGETCDETNNVCLAPDCLVNADCDNGAFCDGTETCVNFVCQNGTSPCLAGETCDEPTDTCTPPPNCVTDADCDNNTFCDGVETCDGNGDCQPGTPPCTGPGETCDAGADVCVPPDCLVDGDCDNGSFCDGTETCVNFTCQPGTSPCAPGDTCDEVNGCVPPPPECVEDADCDNGAYCDGEESCVGGTCQPGSDPCSAGESCNETSDSCEVATATTPKNRFNILMNYELGMHCTGFEFAYCCVLPPYNSILAQVVKTEKGNDFPRLLTADPNVGLDALGRPTVVRDTEVDGSNQFRKYQLRYWHDAQPRNDGNGAPQTSTLISVVEGNSLLMWNTKFDAATTDADGALIYGGYDGATGVMQGDGDYTDDNDNYWNGAWNHLYIYADAAHATDLGPNLEGHGNTGVEADKIRLGVHVVYPENTGAALHPMGPGVVGAGFDNVLTFSKDEGTVVYTQMKVLEDLPVMLTSPRIWEALGLALTPFEDSINFFGDPGAIDEDSLRPYVRMRARLEEYPSGNPVLDNGLPVIGLGDAPIDIPNCERCHSLADGDSVNSAQNGYPIIDQMVQDEMAFWNAYYDIGPGDSDWYSRLKGAAISILAIHDLEHGTSFTANYPASDSGGGNACTAGDPNTIGDPCTSDSDCDSAGGRVCTRGYSIRIGDPCTRDRDCGGEHGQCEWVGGNDGVCEPSASAGTPQYTRLGHESVVCQRCHADNVIAVVKSAYGPDGDLIPPLTEAMHNNHKDNPFSDALGRNGGCQGCHPAHRSDGSMDGYPITETGTNAYQASDNRDAAGGCFVGRDVHSNRNKETDGAGTPEHLNAVGEWLVENVAWDSGEWKGIWCTNCHSQLGQELWKSDNWSDPVNNVGTTLRNEATLADIASGLGISLAQAESWLDPKVPSMAPDGIDHTSAVWTEDPGLCDYVPSLFGATASPYQDGNVATIEVILPGSTPGSSACTAGDPAKIGATCSANSDCDSAGGGAMICVDGYRSRRGDPCETDRDCGGEHGRCEAVSGKVCTAGYSSRIGDPCDRDRDCGGEHGRCEDVGGGNANDGVCTTTPPTEGWPNCSTPVAADGPDCDGDGLPDFKICGTVDVDGDFSVHALTFCTTPDCVANAQATLPVTSVAVPVPFSAATDGRDHWLSAGEPHCADCHQAPYVEQSGTQHPYPPFNYPNKPALFRYTRGHQDITCQGCHESTHGLYPTTTIDTTSYEQAAGLNTDGSHGPLKCGSCHEANAAGTPEWMRSGGFFGSLVGDFDGAIGWAHTYTDEADPRDSVCQNCHDDYRDEVSDDNSEWLKHTMRHRVSRSTMDKVEVLQLGQVSGATSPAATVCRGCHGSETDEVRCSGEESGQWKRHLTEGRVSESVWEAVSRTYAGSTCGY